MINAISKPLISLLKWGTVITATAVVVISLQVNADGDLTAESTNVATNTSTAAVAGSSAQLWAPQLGFADLIERVSPSVVHVATSGVVKRRVYGGRQFQFPRGFGFEDLFPEFRDRRDLEEENLEEKRPLGIGSGFIISADGYVVTNRHVIDKADEIIVTLANGEEYTAEVQGRDQKTDLALLKLVGAKDLPYVSWGDDDKSRVGDWVLAIGNPFGLGGSASTGIISARGRDIRSGPYDDYIQVDAAINRGNSGGPLFNLQGEVIGINTAIYSPNGGNVGIGFSIPANLAKNVIDQLQSNGEVQRAWIGVSIQPLDDDLAEGFGRSNEKGALISEVGPGTPAEKAGIQAGDIILSFDDKQIDKMRDLPRIVATSKVGEKYRVGLWRNGANKTITIKTERFPDDEALADRQPSREQTEEPEADELLGASLSKLTSQLRERYGIDDEVKGVMVVSLMRNGLAAKNGLRPGDVITKLDGKSVTTPEDVSEVISSAKKSGRATVPALLSRNNGARFTPFRLN